MLPQVMEIIITNVDSVQADTSFLDFVKTAQYIDGGRLSGPRRAHKCQCLTRIDFEVNILQYPFLLVIRKPNAVECDCPSYFFGLQRAFIRSKFISIQDIKDAFGRYHSHLQSVESVNQFTYRAKNHVDVH